MSNMRIGLKNLSDSGTVSVTGPTTASGAPASNLQSPLRGRIWAASNTATAAVFTADLGTDQVVDSMALFGLPICRDGSGSRLGFTVKFDLQFGNGVSMSSATVTYPAGSTSASGVLVAGGLFPSDPAAYPTQNDAESLVLLAFCTSITIRKVVITVTYATPVSWQASRLWVGSCWTPTYNCEAGAGITLSPQARIVRTAGGSVRRILQPGYKTCRLTLTRLSAPEVETLFYHYTSSWTAREVLVALYPETSRVAQVMMGTLSDLTHIGEDLHGNHSASFAFEGS